MNPKLPIMGPETVGPPGPPTTIHGYSITLPAATAAGEAKPQPQPKPILTTITKYPHADPARRVCLTWRVLGGPVRQWWYASEGEAWKAAEGLQRRGPA